MQSLILLFFLIYFAPFAGLVFRYCVTGPFDGCSVSNQYESMKLILLLISALHFLVNRMQKGRNEVQKSAPFNFFLLYYWPLIFWHLMFSLAGLAFMFSASILLQILVSTEYMTNIIAQALTHLVLVLSSQTSDRFATIHMLLRGSLWSLFSCWSIDPFMLHYHM